MATVSTANEVAFRAVTKPWIEAIKAATPGATEEHRMELSRQLHACDTITLATGERIDNPHHGGRNSDTLGATVKLILDMIQVAREARQGQGSVIIDTSEPKGMRKEVMNKRDTLIIELYALKAQRCKLMLEVSKIQLAIAEKDILLSQVTFDNHMKKKESRYGNT